MDRSKRRDDTGAERLHLRQPLLNKSCGYWILVTSHFTGAAGLWDAAWIFVGCHILIQKWQESYRL